MEETNKQKIPFMVCVRCFTFNHAPFIKDAMNGFAIQQTSFPFVCTIVDDASTDGEQETIKKYLQEHFDLVDKSVFRNEETDDFKMIFAQHKKNKNCYFAVYFLKYNHYLKKPKTPYIKEWQEEVKYMAICEGDDYWIDQTKIEKQVNYLENHSDICMCTHAYQRVSREKEPLSVIRPLHESNILDTGLVIEKKLAPQTATFLYRMSMNKMPSFFSSFAGITGIGDYPLRVYSAISGGVYYFDEVMSCYRISGDGSWTYRNRDIKIEINTKVIELLKKLDSYTEGKYHKNVTNRINECEYQILVKQGYLLKAFSTPYFKSKKLKKKLTEVLYLINPTLFLRVKKLLNL